MADLSVDPGSPNLPHGGGRAPTIGEWALLQPFIVYAYKKKQSTASLILQELSKRGFSVTDRVLRCRFKQWRIDDKNKRKHKNTEIHRWDHRYAFVSSRAITTGDVSQSANATELGRITDPCTAFEACQTGRGVFSHTRNHRSSILNGAAPDMQIARSFQTVSQLRESRVIAAVANWYDHLATKDVGGARKANSDAISASTVLDNIDTALFLVEHNRSAGWRMLRELGPQICDVLQYALQFSGPTLIPNLLRQMVRWWLERKTDVSYMGCLSQVISLFLSASVANLGQLHPVTLLVDLAAHDDVTLELNDSLYKAIDINYTKKLEDGSACEWRLYIQHCYDQTLVNLESRQDIEAWLGELGGQCSEQSPTYRFDVLLMLAADRIKAGRFVEAELALLQAWDLLLQNYLCWSEWACRMLEYLGVSKQHMDDLLASQQLIEQGLRIADFIRHEWRKKHAVVSLTGIYTTQCNWKAMAKLEAMYPGILDK